MSDDKPERPPRLIVVPIVLREAHALVAQLHRHHEPSRGGLFALGAAHVGAKTVCGVVVVGRPVSRMLSDGWTAEVTRLATDGTAHACGFLYGAAWRAAQAHGYRRLITYTLPEEGGASLRSLAPVWRCIGAAGGGSWSREERPRIDEHPTQEKIRWEAGASPATPVVGADAANSHAPTVLRLVRTPETPEDDSGGPSTRPR